MKSPEVTTTRSFKPEALIYALRRAGFIEDNALSFKGISDLGDEIQIRYTLVQ